MMFQSSRSSSSPASSSYRIYSQCHRHRHRSMSSLDGLLSRLSERRKSAIWCKHGEGPSVSQAEIDTRAPRISGLQPPASTCSAESISPAPSSLFHLRWCPVACPSPIHPAPSQINLLHPTSCPCKPAMYSGGVIAGEFLGFFLI